MIGSLIEYHNPSPGERYGILKGQRKDGKFRVVTGWYGFSGGLGTERISDESVYEKLTPEQIFKRKKSIQDHFKRIWVLSNGRSAATKTIVFSNNADEDKKEGEIKYLPAPVADGLEDFFLSEGWFAYAK